jgi:hypothetical protein
MYQTRRSSRAASFRSTLQPVTDETIAPFDRSMRDGPNLKSEWKLHLFALL